jgi:thiamine biosynthesis lipoprotein
MNVVEHAEFRKQARLMGSSFEFVVVADDHANAESKLQDAIDEVNRIEILLTEFSTTSQTTSINNNAGLEPVLVDQEVFELILRCKQIHKLTQGAFDITAAPLKKLYNFKGAQFNFPSQEQIGEALRVVGSENIETIFNDKILLKLKGMQISFAGIGKGYAADKAKSLLQSKGVAHGVINASGDLTTWGTRANGGPWKVGIADPNDKSSIMLWIPIENAAVATSGDYEQYFEHNGKRYAHTIDPKNGLPVSEIKSVTIVSPSAELSDALATAVFVMGPEAGLNLAEQLPNVHGLVVTADREIKATSHLKFNRVQP